MKTPVSNYLNIFQIISRIFPSILLIAILGKVSTGFAQDLPSQTSLFDGVTLKGWKTADPENQKYWSVIDGVITAGDGIQKVPRNMYLCTEKTYEDFEFSCLVRLTGDSSTGMINSGFQYRSVIEDNKIVGYQADLGNGYWGDIYDEHRRAELVKGRLSVLNQILNKDGWNSYLIRCKGDYHEIYINGVKTAEYVEKDKEISSKGVIGLQLHSGGKAKIEMKHVYITAL